MLTYYELDLGLNHVVRKYSEPLEEHANLLISGMFIELSQPFVVLLVHLSHILQFLVVMRDQAVF